MFTNKAANEMKEGGGTCRRTYKIAGIKSSLMRVSRRDWAYLAKSFTIIDSATSFAKRITQSSLSIRIATNHVAFSNHQQCEK